ncbi:hypothetical protein DOTSEDRAFT_26799 [Dothistroma septosporum NZE10]|uniref:Uncharacterized protein n=1 Tax=Dothistroma septosporum (strain NZE10 / CBS 128990) TaxID=675120 RepID=N1PGC0_DOTSN|nr:hypothetical protein DOTSEDRAFT_26799 [Dothistroma septosporum NZE10]
MVDGIAWCAQHYPEAYCQRRSKALDKNLKTDLAVFFTVLGFLVLAGMFAPFLIGLYRGRRSAKQAARATAAQQCTESLPPPVWGGVVGEGVMITKPVEVFRDFSGRKAEHWGDMET